MIAPLFLLLHGRLVCCSVVNNKKKQKALVVVDWMLQSKMVIYLDTYILGKVH